MDPPGGSGYNDVTQLFNDAAEELGEGELLMVDGFSLNEAMSAVEIGDPRMDSGSALPADQQKPPFDPLAPLLPEEVCWILDQTFACEMHWHAGNALAQTVYTCLYMHHLSTINPDFINQKQVTRFQQAGLPIELVSIVVRAGVMGLVKCCDLAYRELSKGNVHDCEDWQGEKSEIPLYEMVTPQRILAILEEAEAWLASVAEVRHREELLYRIQFRKIILRILDLDMPRKASFIMPLLVEARRLLAAIRRGAVTKPTPGSVAYNAFDPRIARQLNSIMPIRPLEQPHEEETWKALEGLLDGWEQVYALSSCENILAWNTVGLLRSSSPRWTAARLPLIRSLAQSAFSNGAGIFDRYSVLWLVERLFLETAHIPINQLFPFNENNFARSSEDEFFDTLSRLILQQIWASYHNRPRQRRHSMKVSIDWHIAYDNAIKIADKSSQNTSEAMTAKDVSLVILHWRACMIRDIILSGFELELYSSDERPFAYWYLRNVLFVQEGALQELLKSVPQATPAYRYLYSQLSYTTGLKLLSEACFEIFAHKSVFTAARRWTNFIVRFKWALKPDFADVDTPDPFYPDFCAYLQQEKETYSRLHNYRIGQVGTLLEGAQLYLMQSSAAAEADPSLELCRTDFIQHHLVGLLQVLQNLRGALVVTTEVEKAFPSPSNPTSALQEDGIPKQSNAKGNRLMSSQTLYWDLDVCPWFPLATARPMSIVTTEDQADSILQ